MHILLHQTLTTALLDTAEGRAWRKKIFHDQSPWKNVADLAGVKPATSWSPDGCTSNWATKAHFFLVLIHVYFHSCHIRLVSLLYTDDNPVGRQQIPCLDWGMCRLIWAFSVCIRYLFTNIMGRYTWHTITYIEDLTRVVISNEIY